MKMRYLKLLPVLAAGALVLSACSGGVQNPSWPGLTHADQTIYLASGTYVYAVDATAGTKIAQYPAQGGAHNFIASPVVTPDGQVLVGSAGTDHELMSLDAKSMLPKWQSAFVGPDKWIASPLVQGSVVYAPNNNGTLYVLDLATGAKTGSIPLGGELWSAPVSDGKLLYVSSLDHHLYAVDPAAASVSWSVDLEGAVVGSPVLSEDLKTLYVGSTAAKLFAVDTSTHAIVWSKALNGSLWASPAVDGNHIYAADIAHYLYAFDAAGNALWPARDLGADAGAVTANPVVADGKIYVATETGAVASAGQFAHILVFNTEGNPVPPTDVSIKGKLYTTPILVGDTLVVAPMGAEFLVYGIKIADGSQLPWKFDGK